MDAGGQTIETVLFGLGLWLKCAVAGSVVGGAVAAVQIFPGRWHPAWAASLIYWFSCPFLAGVASGVVLALRSIPPLAEGRTFWLMLCLVIGAITAAATAVSVAYLTRNYDPNAASKAKRMAQRSRQRQMPKTADWENGLRALFRPEPTAQENPTDNLPSAAASNAPVTTGRKAKLPPARYSVDSPLAKPPHYAGHPRQIRLGRDKLQKPNKS